MVCTIGSRNLGAYLKTLPITELNGHILISFTSFSHPYSIHVFQSLCIFIIIVIFNFFNEKFQI